MDGAGLTSIGGEREGSSSCLVFVDRSSVRPRERERGEERDDLPAFQLPTVISLTILPLLRLSRRIFWVEGARVLLTSAFEGGRKGGGLKSNWIGNDSRCLRGGGVHFEVRSIDRAVETGDWRAAAPSFFSLGPLLKKGVLRVDRWTDHILKRAHLLPPLLLLILLRRV